jgi:DNA-binding IclR family transcriptional regulator
MALIRTVIRSVWALEILLLMRSQPARVWPAEALVRELRASTSLVDQNLTQLVAGGLVREEEDGFIYGPASPLLDEACAYLEQAYRERPVAVVNLIVGAATDNVQGFADAFKFKRGDD